MDPNGLIFATCRILRLFAFFLNSVNYSTTYNVILINLSLINVFKGCGSQGELICDSRLENWKKNGCQKNDKNMHIYQINVGKTDVP